jgi:hypothetical protein
MSLHRVKAYPPTRGNFSVSAKFFLLRSIFRNHAGTGVAGTAVKGTSTHERGRTWSPPLYIKDLFASGSVARDDLVKGRVRHHLGVHLRRAFHHVHQGFQHCWIGAAVIGVRVLFVVPYTDAHRCRAVWDDEHHRVLEAWLCPQQGNAGFLDGRGKRRDAVRLQLQGNRASQHVNLKSCRLRDAMADNPP